MPLVHRLRHVTAVLGALLVGALLAGCMLTSDENLLAGEAVLVTGGDVFLANYDETEDGFVLSADQPSRVEYFAIDNSYGGSNGDQPVYFVPYDGADRYIIVLAARNTHYGIATLRNGLIEIRILHAGDVAAEVAAAGRNLPDGVTVTKDGVTIPDRASLGTMLEYIADGIITTTPSLSWYGDAPPPPRLVPDGDWYRPAD